jgi:hypothetical protein
MGLLHLAVDPGLTGALCLFDPSIRTAVFWDTPTVTTKVGKKMKTQMDLHAIVRLLKEVTEGHEVFVTIEKVNAMPRFGGADGGSSMGATSAFNFGYGFGMWLGILTALELPFQQVHPATWKSKMMAGCSKEKDASRVKAMQMFPKTAGDLTRKKDHGRADALLIAAWAATYSPQPSAAVEEKEETLF